MTTKKRNYPALRVVDPSGNLRRPKSNERSRTRRPPNRGGVHREQIVSAELLAFPSGGRDDLWPSIGRDAFALLPLGDCPMTLAHSLSHFGDVAPQAKQVGDCAHARNHASDELSESRRITYPVTKSNSKRTIRPMGRGTTQADFVEDFCRRIRAAREMAGYGDRDEFARLMGIEKDTYFRYETRTPLPHRYIPRFLELTGADAQILFTGSRKEQKKAGAA